MTEGSGKGAWMMRKTIGGEESEWEQYWDPNEEPLSPSEVEVRRQRLLEILFAPRPNAPRTRK